MVKKDQHSPRDEDIEYELENANRFAILVLIYLDGELTQSDLSSYLNKTKSAIHYHIKHLMQKNLVIESKTVRARGSIHSKFFSLHPQVITYLRQLDREEEFLEFKTTVSKSFEKANQFLKTIPEFSDEELMLNPNFLLFELLKNELRLKMVLLLFVRGKISLSDLSGQLGKSKSTISRNLQAMEELGVVLTSSFENREKYYSLSSDIYKMFFPISKGQYDEVDDQHRRELALKTVYLFKSAFKLYKTLFSLAIQYLDSLLESINGMEDLVHIDNNLIRKQIFGSNMVFLSATERERFFQYYQEFNQKLMADLQTNKEVDRPYMFFGTILDLNQLLTDK
ncbi:MAG: winged helix-turn-helix transcriptional regulator [Candidatus Thorarchaeota archaeon]